ncbi:MAG: ATP-grasp domain-containing protein [Pseudonocardia sp.]|uniref:acetyl/propionyl/methylcrotonyl-CoA carboxylase subunit alpha n=1 Tax=unclassified Pseudonocardia TaxID=2619320 RepID=UPI00086E3A28|nr:MULTISPECIES: biotin carboxylase N-terminal domain-containing protein [unclassified Pseudonocardia]MBN9113244.1 ATP-grasp domain-containing protein [Pseudonocardia sp.]ODV00837.1 MAG: acetyl/propionyl-CoA carboxylase subuit alpha [Pseudonocardia sp. SCN 73-27]
MFSTVLVANRGEIALRVIRTLRRLGIRSVAVYTDVDAGSPHVAAADVAVSLGATNAYLSIERVLDAARATGADAVHPGYGFLSENTAFAAACEDAGIVFVGPPASAIEAMGDKIRAKQTVAKAGVPVVPGSDGAGLSDDDLAAAVDEIGYPVLLKPSAGGGGKGMVEVHRPEDLVDAIVGARRVAKGAFGDDTLLVERLVTTPRHIEIQVMADAHGTVVHLGERECSLQRRHQKIVEEAPSALLTPEQRQRMGAAAVEAARSVGYTGAGTVEFIVGGDRPDEFFFMEMNTRLQVEHPVTEMVTGLDLVELQLRVAAGEPLPIGQDDVRLDGHAIEVRVYAEDPAAGFLPTGGRILAFEAPTGAGIRTDAGIESGGVVGSDYDPMLAKVIAHGADRDEAIRRLDTALAHTTLLGLGTNIGFLRALLADGDVRAANLDTGLVGRRLDDWASADLPADVLGAATGVALLDLEPTGAVVDPFDIPGGWRLGDSAATTRTLLVPGHDPVEVTARGRAADASLIIGGSPAESTSTELVSGNGRYSDYCHSQGGVTRRYRAARADDGTLWIGRDGYAWAVREQGRLEAARADAASTGGPVVSPMPGTVTVVDVAEGDTVVAGQRLVVVEAMKMEHVLTAPADGVVRDLRARAGAAVAKDAVLLTVDTEEN